MANEHRLEKTGAGASNGTDPHERSPSDLHTSGAGAERQSNGGEQMNLPQLAERDRQCLRLLADGYKDEDIATRLGIAARTVRFHIDKVKRAFGATSRVHMIALAIRANMLSVVFCVAT
ncbi:MAG: hypothetical protein GC190_12620 [Alphaproteobacteria bacterium]|nr:hypothetical protein [Alphaproteobacteria bacterium]